MRSACGARARDRAVASFIRRDRCSPDHVSVVETPVVETPVVETLWTTTVVVSAAWASIMRRLAQTTPEEREEFARQAAREASESLPRCSSPTRRQ